MRRSDDGSLLKKKQEQWAREKDEGAQGWYPWGSPGGGNPNKKHVARDYDHSKQNYSTRQPSCTENVPPADPGEVRHRRSTSIDGEMQRSTGMDMMDSSHHSMYPPMYGTVPLNVPQQGLPRPFVYFPPDHQHSQHIQYMQFPGAHPYSYIPPSVSTSTPFPVQCLPPGAIPISTPTLMTSSYTERWASQVPDWNGVTRVEEVNEDNASGTCPPITHVSSPVNNTTVISVPGPPSFQSRPVQECIPSRDLPHAYVTPIVSSSTTASVLAIPVLPGGRRGSSYAGSLCDARCGDDCDVAEPRKEGNIYETQIAERRRLAAKEEEKERQEEERVRREREKRETARKREEEKKIEEDKRREEERERSANAVLEAIEKARKEAELFKKMRLHRHAMDAEGVKEREKNLLGVEDDKILDQMKKKVDAFERHSRMEQEEIARNAPPKDKQKHRSASLSRSPSIAFHHEVSPSIPSPFRRTGSLIPRGHTRRSEVSSSRPSTVDSSPSSSVPFDPPQQESTPLKRDAKSRYSLRSPSSPSITSRSPSIIKPVTRSFPPKPQPIVQSSSLTPIHSLPPRHSPVSQSFTIGRSTSRDSHSPRSDETFTTSPSVTCRVEEPMVGRTSGIFLPRSALKETNRTREPSEERKMKSHIPIPLPRMSIDSRMNADITSLSNPLFTPILTRPRRMRISKDGEVYRREDSMDSASVTSSSDSDRGGEGIGEGRFKRPQVTVSSRTIPHIEVDSSEEVEETPVKMFTPRFSSRPSTPNGDRSLPRTHYADRIRGVDNNHNGAPLSALPARVTESLQPTVQPRDGLSSLSSSLRNLRISMNNLNATSGDPSSASPEVTDSPMMQRFHSRTSQYRSLNLKKGGTDKNQQLLDRLSALRERLHNTDAYKSRPLSRQGSSMSIASRHS